MGGWAINPYLAYMGTADDCNAATEALYAALRVCSAPGDYAPVLSANALYEPLRGLYAISDVSGRLFIRCGTVTRLPHICTLPGFTRTPFRPSGSA